MDVKLHIISGIPGPNDLEIQACPDTHPRSSPGQTPRYQELARLDRQLGLDRGMGKKGSIYIY